jgi:hypothetical protein
LRQSTAKEINDLAKGEKLPQKGSFSRHYCHSWRSFFVRRKKEKSPDTQMLRGAQTSAFHSPSVSLPLGSLWLLTLPPALFVRHT